MPTLNIADLSLAIIWLFFGIRGYLRGLVKEVGSLAAIITGFYCAGTYHKELAPHLTEYISGNYAGTAAYLLIFTVALIAVWFLALAVSGMVKVTMTQWADRFFGGFFGLAKGVILTAVFLFLIHLASPNPDFLKGSLLVPVLEKVSAKLVRYIPPDINEKLRKFGKKDAVEAVKAATEKKPAEPAKAEPEKKPAEPAKAGHEKKQPEPAKVEPEKKPAEPVKAGGDKKKAAPGHADPHKDQTAKKPAPKKEAEAAAPAP
uniref:Putative membrane protein, required for colicin V production n=1 Tax=Desulfovibrio sp. U5L TaxID=596152 RepID=I2PZ66_9BACT